MLAIRMQRTGRKGHAMFRMVVQDSRLTPTSGKVVAQLGSYDPHSKAITVDKEKVAFYLEHGAQPSDRVARLIKNEGVKLPDWVKLPADKTRTVRNAEKRRSTAPAKPVEAAPAAAPPAVETAESTDTDVAAEPPEALTEQPDSDTPVEQTESADLATPTEPPEDSAQPDDVEQSEEATKPA